MIDGVTDEVREWIADRFDDRLIDFHFFSFDLQLAFFAELRAEIAYDPRKLAEDITNRLHTRLHDRFLQIACHTVELAGRCLQSRTFVRCDRLQQLVAA